MTTPFSPFDFSGPYFRAAIITDPDSGSEHRYELWQQNTGKPTKVGASDAFIEVNGLTGSGSDLELTSLAFVSDVSVELKLGMIPTLTATLTPPLEDARKFLDSKLIEFSTSVLEIIFGYTTGPTGPVSVGPFRGLIAKPDVSYGEDMSISLSAVGVGGFSLAQTGHSGETPAGKSSLNVIDDFAKELNVPRGEDLLSNGSIKALDMDAQVVSGNKSYLSVIYGLAQLAGCWLDLTNNNLRLVSMDKLTTEKAGVVLRLYDFPGQVGKLQNGVTVFPILSASSTTDGIYLNNFSKRALRTAMDRRSKEQTEGEIDPKKGVSQDKAQTVPDNKSTEKSNRTDQAQDQRDSAAANVQEEAVKAQLKYLATDGSGIHLEIETLGFPELLPAMNVEVYGLGNRIDGTYTVFTATHRLSSSGYVTTVTLVQNSGQLTLALKDGLASGVFGQGPEVGNALQTAGATTDPMNVSDIQVRT